MDQETATIKQLDYLTVLQKQHGINAEIAVDCLRKEISERIAALVAKPEGSELGS